MIQKTKTLKCKCCNKKTLHYLIGNSYRCVICNTDNARIKSVVFEPEIDLDNPESINTVEE